MLGVAYYKLSDCEISKQIIDKIIIKKFCAIIFQQAERFVVY